MKLPFNSVIAPMMRPYLVETKNLCENPTFSFSVPYTYFYSALGFLISANHLRKHLGENPGSSPSLAPTEAIENLEKDFMLVHDLKIIATSMGIVQYACLLAGCYTKSSHEYNSNLCYLQVQGSCKEPVQKFLLRKSSFVPATSYWSARHGYNENSELFPTATQQKVY